MDAVLNRGDLCTESVFAAQAGLQSLLYFSFCWGRDCVPHPPERWSLHPQCLIIWLYLEVGLLGNEAEMAWRGPETKGTGSSDGECPCQLDGKWNHLSEPAPTKSAGGIWVGAWGLRKCQIERNGDRNHKIVWGGTASLLCAAMSLFRSLLIYKSRAKHSTAVGQCLITRPFLPLSKWTSVYHAQTACKQFTL